MIHDGSHVYGKEIIMVIESTPISNFLSFVLHVQYYYFSFFFFGRGVKRDGVIFHFIQHMCVSMDWKSAWFLAYIILGVLDSFVIVTCCDLWF